MKTLIKIKGICFIMIWFLFFHTLKIFSQEYKFKIGGINGTSFYMGDANKTKLYQNPDFAGGAIFRYNLSFHWAVKATLLAGNVSGNSARSNNHFPFQEHAAFNRSFSELSTQVEFNFLPFSDKYKYLNTKRYTPYIFTGAGVTYAKGEYDFKSLNMPFGIGFKYKLKNRMNIGIEFSMRNLFRDDFDVTDSVNEWSLNNPYNIKSSSLKNQDRYSLTMIFLTWEFDSREDSCR